MNQPQRRSAPRRAPGGSDAGAQMLPFYAEARRSFTALPQWPEILPDVTGIEAETHGLNSGGFPRFVVGDEFVLPRGTGLHESTHAWRLVLNRLRGDEVLRPYVEWRNLGYTLEQWQAEKNAQTTAQGRWMYDPNESFAEAGRIALMGGGSEKTMNWGHNLDPVATLAFFKSLSPVAPPTPPPPAPVIWNDPITTNGRCPFAIWDPSPNYSPGWLQSVRGTMQHSPTVPFASALATLKNGTTGARRVSAHFLIHETTGEIRQLVSLANRSWAQISCNETHWSIENGDGGDHADPVRTPKLYASSARLNAWLAKMGAYAIALENLPPHRSCVNTACPSGLDLERIVAEAGGGEDMVSREEFDQLAAVVGSMRDQTIPYIANRLAIDAHHRGHSPDHKSEPIVGAQASKSVEEIREKLAKIPPMPKRARAPKPATKARAAAGHGATPEQRSYAERAREETRR